MGNFALAGASDLVLPAAVAWGPVAAWAGAGASLLSSLVAILIVLGLFDALRGPRVRLTFEAREPWCRTAALAGGGTALWVRIGVANAGRRPARGCVGRLIGLTTDRIPRADVDPVQLRWAGVPRARAFEAVDLRRGQREFLNVLALQAGGRWRLVTFEDPDFDPGFLTELPPDREHLLRVAVFSDNAATTTCDLVATVQEATGEIALRMREHAAAGEKRRDPQERGDEGTTVRRIGGSGGAGGRAGTRDRAAGARWRMVALVARLSGTTRRGGVRDMRDDEDAPSRPTPRPASPH